MDADLKFFLAEQPTTVAELSRLTGRSQTWVRDNLKKYAAEITVTDDPKGKIYSIVPGQTPTQDEAPTIHTVEDVDPADAPETGQEGPVELEEPAEGTETALEPMGEPGTFLGGFLRDPKTGKTYNLAGKEVTLPEAQKKARKILNPQYKINAKIDAVAKAGGSLTYEKTTRLWTLALNGKTQDLTAKEFSELTPETIVAA